VAVWGGAKEVNQRQRIQAKEVDRWQVDSETKIVNWWWVEKGGW
jgi:hypothetical protein